MTSMPTVFPGGFTVLMAVYRGDDAALFERAVRSVFDNTLRPDAFILVVDGPIPLLLSATVTRLEAEFSLDVERLAQNVGLARGLNAGLARVQTEWVVRADADDFNLPERFERQARAASGLDAPDLFGSAIREVERDGQPLAIRRPPSNHQDIVQYAQRRNPFNHMTVAYRKEVACRCGGYPLIHQKEDYGLWALMLKEGARTMNLADVLVDATTGRDMYRRRGGWRYALAEIDLQRHLVRCKLKSTFSATLHGLLRGAVFLLPAGLRGWIYERLLRA